MAPILRQSRRWPVLPAIAFSFSSPFSFRLLKGKAYRRPAGGAHSNRRVRRKRARARSAWRDGCARSPHNVTRCANAHTSHVSRDVPPSSAGFIIDEGGRGESGRLARAVGIPRTSARRHGCTRRPLGFAARIPQGPDARHTEVFRMCRASGHKGAAPSREDGTLHACRAGVPRVQRGLICEWSA